jgi:hypothetical protein
MVKTDDRYGILFRVELLANKQVTVNVTRKKGGAALLTMLPSSHDPSTLTNQPGYEDLSTA